MINSGGSIGAGDLLQAPQEIIELDLSMPITQLANQVRDTVVTFAPAAQ